MNCQSHGCGGNLWMQARLLTFAFMLGEPFNVKTIFANYCPSSGVLCPTSTQTLLV